MKTFWMRWYGGDNGDPRPITYPVPVEWWHSGTRADGICTICALVFAETVEAAWEQVRVYWPEAEESSAEERESGWRPSPDRFPPRAAAAPA